MAKADLLRVHDVRDAYRLIGECRDLGRDPALWQSREVVADAAWYGSTAWNDYRRPAYIDDQLTSVYQVPESGAVGVIALIRARNERPFSPRQQRLLTFFHTELGPLIGKSLVSDAEPRADALSPRLRQTLVYLLEGDSEKQIASRLRLSQATIHEYVTALYRHFGVRSRAQLMAHAIKRVARADWKQLHADR